MLYLLLSLSGLCILCGELNRICLLFYFLWINIYKGKSQQMSLVNESYFKHASTLYVIENIFLTAAFVYTMKKKNFWIYKYFFMDF